MRIFVAGLATETNTFAPWPTGLRGFEESGVFRGDSTTRGTGTETDLLIRRLRSCAAADGHEVIEGLFAFAQPSGPTLQSVYESFREEILSAVRGQQHPLDVVLLFLHGAMVATECDDCEGDIIARVRGIVGARVVIGVELDPHCHLTSAMTSNADLIILMKEYPHFDFLERADELYRLAIAKALGKIRPIMSVFDCKMVGFYPTTTEPMAGMVREIRSLEKQPSILSISIVHGFPWGDTAESGTKVLVVADADANLAATTAERVGTALYERRAALLPKLATIQAGLDQAASSPGRVVVADTADNAGGGAPSDNVALLKAMLVRRFASAAFGCVWDPIVAQVCAEAGVGSKLWIRIGGKCGLSSGDPMDLQVTVRAVSAEHSQKGLGESRVRMGLSVWVESGGVDIVINSLRTQTFAPDAFTGLGIDIESKRLLAVKSSWHFQAHFAPIADRIIPLATPGAIEMDFAHIDYRKKRDLNFFPRVADPLGLGASK